MNAICRFLSRHPRGTASAALCAGALAIFIGGAQPFAVNLIPSPWDKIAHALLFAVMAAATTVASGVRSYGGLLVAAMATAGIGAFDELHQRVLPGRNAGWDDLAADLLGAILGVLIVHGLRIGALKKTGGS